MRRSLLVAVLMAAALIAVLGRQATAQASVGGVAPSACHPTLTAFTAPTTAFAGDTVSGKVGLSCAPNSDVKISLSSDQPALKVPGTVTVRRGQTGAVVPLTAKLVDGAQYTAHVTARYKGRSLNQDVTVAPGLKTVQIPPSSALNSVSLNIHLTGPAPAGGTTVRIASDNPAVTVPETVFLDEGSVGVGTEEGIRVHPVTQDTTVTLSFTLGTRTLTASTVLVPPFDGSQGMIFRLENQGDLYGLQFSEQLDLILANPAPAGGVPVQVSVVDDNPAIQLESGTDVISEGDNRAAFRLDTTDVTRTTRVTLKATALQATAFLEITIHPRITAITLPESVKSGTTFEGTVTLAGPSDVDTDVFLQPSSGILDIVPSTVTIPAGATSATFQVRSIQIDEPSTDFVTAYLGRTTLQSDNVTLTP
jgi:hypothetical protein